MTSSSNKALIGPALLLLCLTLVALATRPLIPIDETRYVSVAWEMWLRDEYLVLFKNGEPYSDKPPLLFWLYNLGWAAFGVNGWWPRLVSPLFSLGCLFLTQSIARRLWPTQPDAGSGALWILASSLLWMVFSTAAMFDVMLTFMALVGIRGLVIAATQSMRRGFTWLAMSIGFGVLAKGPVILLHVLPAALLVPWWQRRQLPNGASWKAWYAGLGLAVLAGAALALAWAIPAAIHGGDSYRRAIFWGQTANRMVDSFAHKRPFWWYLPLLPILLFPWLFWPVIWRRLAGLRSASLDSGLRLCIAWATPAFVAFSLISGKQVHYLVPLFPAFALLAARLLPGARVGSIGLPATVTALVGLVMAYFAVTGMPGKYADWHPMAVWPGAALVVIAAALGWTGRVASRRMPSLAMLGATMLAALLVSIGPDLTSRSDVAPIARRIKQMQDDAVPVAYLGGYHGQFQFAGRLLQPLELLREDSLPQWLVAHPQGVVVMTLERNARPQDVLFQQPYLDETIAIVNAPQMRDYLAHHALHIDRPVGAPKPTSSHG